MSRAFVKEPDGDQVVDEQPERPQSPHPNYVTPVGFAQLEQERAELSARAQELPQASNDMAEAETLKHIERDLRYIDGRIERAILIDPADQPPDEIAFGAVVEVVDEDDEQHRFAIVGEDEADAPQGKVSWVSPLARALLGARAGETVTWERPAGSKELEVVGFNFPAAAKKKAGAKTAPKRAAKQKQRG